jgi:hypothetical protein
MAKNSETGPYRPSSALAEIPENVKAAQAAPKKASGMNVKQKMTTLFKRASVKNIPKTQNSQQQA